MNLAVVNAIRFGLLMFCVTVVGMLGLFAFIQEGNWPMVALFCIAEPAASVLTLLCARAAYRNWGLPD